MALVKCPNCGKTISSKASKCPNCGYNKNKKALLFIFAVIIISIVAVAAVFILRYLKTKKEEARQSQIEELILMADEKYHDGQLQEISSLYDQLDELGYDTNRLRETLDYDIKVRDDVINYYNALKKLDDTLRYGGSINAALSALKAPTEQFNSLEENGDSKYGQYIKTIRNNPMYIILESEFIKNTDTNFDAWIVQGGYQIVISTYTDELLEHPLPYSD